LMTRCTVPRDTPLNSAIIFKVTLLRNIFYLPKSVPLRVASTSVP
jgi:hypothetical protein